MSYKYISPFEEEKKGGFFGIGDKTEKPTEPEYNYISPFEEEQKEGSSILRRAVADPLVALAKGTLVDIPETLTGIADIPTLGYAGKAVEGVGRGLGIGGFKEGREFFDKMLTPETQEAKRKVSEAEGGLETLKTAVQNPSVIAQTVMESIPSMVAGTKLVGGAAKALGYGLKQVTPRVATAAREAATLGEGATLAQARALKMAEAVQKTNLAKAAAIGGIAEGLVTTGQINEQVRQDPLNPSGTLTPEQLAIHAVAGFTTGAIGALSGRLANRLGLIDPQTFIAMMTNGGIARNAAEKMTWTKFLADGLKTMAREGFLEELPQSMQEQVAQNLSLGKPLDDQVFEQGALGLLAGMAQAGGAHTLSSAMDRMRTDPIDQQINKEMAAIGGVENDVVNSVPKDQASQIMKEVALGVTKPEVQPETAPPPVETKPVEPPAETPAGLERILGGKSQSQLRALFAEQPDTPIGKTARALWNKNATNAEKLLEEKERAPKVAPVKEEPKAEIPEVFMKMPIDQLRAQAEEGVEGAKKALVIREPQGQAKEAKPEIKPAPERQAESTPKAGVVSTPYDRGNLAEKTTREIDADILRTLKEQKKRKDILSSQAKIDAYAKEQGMPSEDMAKLLKDNYEGNATELARMEKYTESGEYKQKKVKEKAGAGKVKFAEAKTEPVAKAPAPVKKEEVLAEEKKPIVFNEKPPDGARDISPEASFSRGYKPQKQSIVTNETPEANVYDEKEGFFSDSNYYVKQKPPKKVNAKTKSLNMGDINPAFPDADAVNEQEHKEFAEEGWALPAEIVGESKEKGSTTVKAQVALRDREKYNDKRSFSVDAKYVDAILTQHPDAKPFVSETEKLSTLVFTKGEGGEIVGLVVIDKKGKEEPKAVVEKKPPEGAYESNLRMVNSFPPDIAKEVTNIPTKEEYDIAYRTVREDANEKEQTASDVMRHLLFAMNPKAFPEDQNITIVGKIKKAIGKETKSVVDDIALPDDQKAAIREALNKEDNAYVRSIFEIKYLFNFLKKGTDQYAKQAELRSSFKFGYTDINNAKFKQYEEQADEIWNNLLKTGKVSEKISASLSETAGVPIGRAKAEAITYPTREEPYQPADLKEMGKIADKIPMINDLIRYLESTGYKEGGVYGRTSTVVKAKGRESDSISTTEEGQRRKLDAQDATFSNTESKRFSKLRQLIAEKGKAIDAFMALEAKRQNLLKTYSLIKGRKKGYFQRELLAIDKEIASIEDQMAKMEIPKTFELDTTAYDQQSKEARDLGKINGFEVVFFVDHTNTLNGFINHEDKIIFMNRNSQKTPVEIVGHELSHEGVEGYESNEKTLTKIDTTSKAFKAYWEALSFIVFEHRNELLNKRQALVEYAADLQGGMTENYGVILNEGLFYANGDPADSLSDQPRMPIDVIAKRPIWSRFKTRSDLKSTNDRGLIYILSQNKKPIPIGIALNEYEKDVRPMRLKGLRAALSKNDIILSFDSTMMKDRTLLTEYSAKGNVIFVNVEAFKEVTDAASRFENSILASGIKALLEISQKSKLDQPIARLRSEVIDVMRSIYPYAVNAPENVQKIILGAKEEGILAYITNPDFAGWLDSIPHFRKKQEGRETLWTRLRDAVLRYVGIKSAEGMTKLDAFIEILDRNVYTRKSPAEIAQSAINEALKFKSVDAYIAAKSHYKYQRTSTRVRGIIPNEYLYSHKVTVKSIVGGKMVKTQKIAKDIVYEPKTLEDAIMAKWTPDDMKGAMEAGTPWTKEINTMVERYLKLRDEITETDEKMSDYEAIQNELIARLMPIAWRHTELRNIYETAHGLRSTQKYFKSPELQRIADQAEGYIGESEELGMPIMTLSKGVTVTNLRKNIQDDTDVEIKAEQIIEGEQQKVPALDEIVEPEFLVLAKSLLKARSTAEIEGIKSHIRGRVDKIYHYEPEDKRALRAESIILEVEKAVNDLAAFNQTQKGKLLGQNKRLSFVSLTARGRWRRKSGVSVGTTVPVSSLPNELWELKTKAGIKLTPEEMQAYQVQQKAEKQKTRLRRPKTEATTQWIIRKYGQEIAVLTMDKKGDTIKITGMVGEQASVLDAIAGVFRSNPKKTTIEVSLDPETDQLSRETQTNLMTTVALFGGNYVDGVMTLKRDAFTNAVEAVRQTDDIPKDKLEAKIFAHIRGEDIVKATGKTIRQNVRLTAEEERSLIETYHTTTEPRAKAMAMNRIIAGLQGFVGSIAKGYKEQILNKPSMEIQDLVNQGNIGLITALNRYDISKEDAGRLATYAQRYIFAAINDYIKQGATHKNIRNDIVKAEKEIRDKGGTVTPESIQANLKAAGKKYRLSTIENALALRMMDNAVSLDLGGEDTTALTDALRDSAFTGEEKHLTGNSRLLLQNLYRQLMGTLTDAEQDVIRGVVLEERKQKDVAADLGISQQSVSGIQKQAIAKMMKELERRGMGKYTTDAEGNEVFKRKQTIEGEGEQADSLWEAQLVGERALTADDIISGSFMDNIVDRARNFPTMIKSEYAQITQKQISENVLDNLPKMPNSERKRFDSIAMQYGGIRHRIWRKIFSLPWQNAKKSRDWMKAFLISVRRISARDEMAHDWVKIGQPFLKMGAYLKAKGFTNEQAKKIKEDVYRFIIHGDENLPTKIAGLKDQAATEKNEQKRKELEAKIARYEEFRSYLPEDAEQGIKDYDGKLIKLHPVAYDIYRSAMMTEQAIFTKLIDHAQEMLFMQYQKQAWFKIMANSFGEDVSRSFTLLVGKALKGISTEEGIKNIDEQGIKIQFRDIFKNINAEYDAIMSEKTKASVAESYDRLFEAISSQIADLKKILKTLEPKMSKEELERSIREMIVAYQYTRPRLQKIKTLRNEWRNWPGFFPRFREKGKYKFVVHKKEFDGDIEVKKEVYSAMVNSTGEVDQLYGDMLKKLSLKDGLPDTYETNLLPVSELPDYMFEGIKDFNIEALVNSAVEKMDVKGVYFDEAGREVDVRREIWDSIMESIAGQFQARAAAAHGTHRKQAIGEKAIKGYQEDNLGDVLSNHITMMAGFLTKQTSAYEYLELMQELEDKTRKAELQEYVNGQLRNDTELDRASSKMRAFAFLWFLGGMIKSAVVNSTQPYVVGIPEMAKWMRDNNIKGSATLMQLKMSWAIVKNFRILYQDPDAWAEIQLIKAGPNSTAEQKAAAADLNMALVTYLRENIINGIMAAQHMRFIKGELSGSFSGKFNKIFDILAFPFAMAEKNNRMTSGGAMFAMAYANYRKTMPADKAYNKASDAATTFINDVHYPIGKHNLPILAQSGTALGVALKTAYTFRPFTHNFLLNQFNMLRSARHLFSKDEVARARASSDLKTVIHTMAVMALFGGFLGLPFLKDLFEFSEKHFGTSPKQWLRKTLRAAGGEHLETLGMYGVPGMLGANLSGSLSIGIPFFGDQSNLDSVFGVYAGLGKKGVMASQAFGRGDYYRVMANLSPEFIRGPMVALTESDFGRTTFGFRGHATTTKGLPSYSTTGEPLKYEGAEVGLKLLGFQPTRISKEREIEQTVKKQVMWANEQKQNISESYRIDRIQKNPEAMKTMLSAVRKLNLKIKDEKIPVPRANISTIIKNSRGTKNLQKRRELARRLQISES